MYDPEQLRTFLAVAESLSFTQAAARLEIGQPTVSQHVRKLESSVGRRLFVRDTHTASCTHVLVNVFEIIIGEYHASADALDRLGNECRDLPGGCVVDQVLHISGIFATGLGVITAPHPAVRVGR